MKDDGGYGLTAETIKDAAEIAAILFNTMEWRWGWRDPHVPTVGEIADRMEYLREKTYEADQRIPDPRSSTGRLMVQKQGRWTRIYVEVGQFYEMENDGETVP